MKIVIFAGGSGTRFWPISREKYPKQFKPLINNKSTFQIHLENYVPQFGIKNIFVSTTEMLSGTVKEIFPSIPLQNIITEPVRRDLGPAVALVMMKLAKMGDLDEPVAIVWSDSYIKNVNTYFSALKTAEQMLVEDKNQIFFIGEQPQYPNENLGWIETGEQISSSGELHVSARKNFHYRPSLELATKWFEQKTHLWNTGYFVTTPGFILEKYKALQPKMYEQMEKIKQSLDTDDELETLQTVYAQMESISFDNAILEGIDNSQTKVISGNFQWADPGTLYALKQFFQNSDIENVTKGSVYNYKTQDTLVYNYVDNQLVTTIGLEGFIVVNTPDAVLVCHKSQIPEIKNMLKKFEDTDFTKYL